MVQLLGSSLQFVNCRFAVCIDCTCLVGVNFIFLSIDECFVQSILSSKQICSIFTYKYPFAVPAFYRGIGMSYNTCCVELAVITPARRLGITICIMDVIVSVGHLCETIVGSICTISMHGIALDIVA